jgi:hypothetical protein
LITWQLSLSGNALRVLVAIREGNVTDNALMNRTLAHFITAVRALEREGLITHEHHVGIPREGEQPVFATPGRKYHYEITTKGELALQLAAFDLQDFLAEVGLELSRDATPTLTERGDGA